MSRFAAVAIAALAALQSVYASPLPDLPGTLEKRQSLSAPFFSLYSDKGSGVADPTTLTGWNAFLLSFWLTEGPWDNVEVWSTMSADDRTSTHSAYNAAGIKLMVSAFGSTDVPTTSGADPTTTAQNLATWVLNTGPLDGVDIDYEDFDAMNGGTGEAWLITFTNELRSQLGDSYLISHAPVAPWFTDGNAADGTPLYPGGGYLKVNSGAGSAIDFYNIQFYNQETEYEDCTTLVTDSNPYPHTSILEMMANGVSGDKIVLGKPGTTGDQDNGGYVDPTTLAGCVSQAKAGGWNGGLMVWEYPDEPADWVSEVWGST